MKSLLPFQRRGWVLLLLFPLSPGPSQLVPAPVGLRVALAQPNRIYSLADSVEVVLHNPDPNALQVIASTALVPNAALSRRRVFLALNVFQKQVHGGTHGDAPLPALGPGQPLPGALARAPHSGVQRVHPHRLS